VASPDASDLPANWTAVINVVGFLVAIGAAAFGYFKHRPRPEDKIHPEVEIVGGAFADRAAIQRLAESNDDLAAAVKDATMSLRRLAETRERTPESIDRLTQALERAVEQYERAVKIHGEDIGRKIDDAARFMRSNL